MVAVEGNLVRVTSEREVRNPAFGTMRAQIQQHGARRHAGLQQGARDRRHRLPRRDGLARRSCSSSASRTRSVSSAGRHHDQGREPTKITVSGASKYLVGQVAADIRGFRPPEPYKGKA